MPFIGGIIPANVGGLDPKAQKLRREREEKKRVQADGQFARALDEADLESVEAVEEVDSAREVQAAQSEEGREDREKLGYYEADGAVKPGAERRPRIDLEG